MSKVNLQIPVHRVARIACYGSTSVEAIHQFLKGLLRNFPQNSDKVYVISDGQDGRTVNFQIRNDCFIPRLRLNYPSDEWLQFQFCFINPAEFQYDVTHASTDASALKTEVQRFVESCDYILFFFDADCSDSELQKELEALHGLTYFVLGTYKNRRLRPILFVQTSAKSDQAEHWYDQFYDLMLQQYSSRIKNKHGNALALLPEFYDKEKNYFDLYQSNPLEVFKRIGKLEEHYVRPWCEFDVASLDPCEMCLFQKGESPSEDGCPGVSAFLKLKKAAKNYPSLTVWLSCAIGVVAAVAVGYSVFDSTNHQFLTLLSAWIAWIGVTCVVIGLVRAEQNDNDEESTEVKHPVLLLCDGCPFNKKNRIVWPWKYRLE